MTPGATTNGQLRGLHRFIGGGRVVSVVALLIAFVAATAWSVPHPAAPWALQWADGALGRGRPDRAVLMYDAVASQNPSLDVQRVARQRAALVYATQLGQPEAARRHLDALVPVTGRPEARAALLESIGELLMEEHEPAGAAARFEAASRADPEHPRAGRRLLRAGHVLAAARRDKQADALYRRVQRDHPALSGDALIGRAQIKLRKGRIEQAMALFEDALNHTYDADVLAVARLGRTTCLERLGDLDSALAELEEVGGVSPDVIGERQQALRSRQWSGAE